MAKLFVRHLPPIKFTQKGYDDLVSQREKLLSQRPQAVANLREAREMGDLSENGYYKEARARLSFIDGRLRHFDRLLKRAKVVKNSKKGVVEIGSEVTIKSGSKKLTYAIVGGYESDPSKGTISHRSPLGKTLIGKKAKDKFILKVPAGEKKYTILTVN
jgi:transcription elongation factor GreA